MLIQRSVSLLGHSKVVFSLDQAHLVQSLEKDPQMVSFLFSLGNQQENYEFLDLLFTLEDELLELREAPQSAKPVWLNLSLQKRPF